MWWLHIKSVINVDFINGCINVISRICRVYLIYLMMGSPLCCRRLAGPVCTESECVSSCVTCLVMLARVYSGLGSMAFFSSVIYVVVVLACIITHYCLLPFLCRMLLINTCYIPDSHIRVCYWQCVLRLLRLGCLFLYSCKFTVTYIYWSNVISKIIVLILAVTNCVMN